ncbi:hypothetical protein BKA62DRAFT_701918 [Auriculariales sp. MPI-PUGE-AT-0066]|nr:hypothetical protein BKA62DRAFT_701918 [Auriculariales sp. MPI-PUGE-AT-0066]
MRSSFGLSGPFVALCLALFVLRVEAISACRGFNTQFGSLEIDLRTKSKIIPSKPTGDLLNADGSPQSVGQIDCRKVPSVKTSHCWERKPEPKKPATPKPVPGKKPKPWVPNYVTDAGMKVGPPAKCGSTTTILDYTCDHILELNFLQRVMNQAGGACEKALAESTSKVKYEIALGKLRDIRHQMNNFQNLAFHQGGTAFPGTPEDFKTRTVSHWVAGGGVTQAAADVWKLGGLNDYINKREKKALAAIGGLADQKIKAMFSGATDGVEAAWRQFMTDVETSFNAAVAAHKQQLADAAKAEEECAKQAAAGGSNPPATRRLARRHALSVGSVSETSTLWPSAGGVFSSLTTRARRAAPRTGPKAPRAKSCPCKQVPAKKQVPRSKVKQRPAPAKQPRVPAKRPATRTPARPKQVAKRPANRPRRTPGKKATPRRPSPKRKPKAVPRPTRKPKGKPRPRRRR